MAVTEWKYYFVAVTEDLQLGTALAKLVSPFNSDAAEDNAFVDSPLTPSGWVTSFPAKKVVADMVDAFNEDAPITDSRLEVLTSRGMTAEVWEAAKAAISISYYQHVSDDGTLQVQGDFMSNYITSLGKSTNT